MNQRVYITGLGAQTNLGAGAAALWQALLDGRTRVAALPAHWRRHARFRTDVWAPMGEPDWMGLGLSRPEFRQLDPAARLAVLAAGECLADAGIEIGERDPHSGRFPLPGTDCRRLGVFLGTGGAGTTTILDSYHHHAAAQRLAALRRLGLPPAAEALLDDWRVPRRVDPFTAPKYMPNAFAAAVGIRYGITGINRTICASCASGTLAVGQAFEAIRAGRLEQAIAGGADYSGDQLGGVLLGFDMLGALAHGDLPPQAINRPFDQGASGFVFAEGGCATLLLESERSAERRGARVYAEVVGAGESFDAHSAVVPLPDAACASAMILETCGDYGPECVDYLNPHATGTAANDSIELALIRRLYRPDVRINTTKSFIGHTLGAAGAIEALVCARSLHEQRTHGCLNLTDPLQPAAYVLTPESFRINFALTQSFGFGGHNAALLLAAAPA